MTDLACALNHSGDIELIEAFCSQDSMLTKVACRSGLKAERWTIDDFDLSSERGYLLAEQRLRQIRPKCLWLSPECGPFSQMQNTNQRTPEQIANLMEKRKQGLRQWKNSIRLAWVQLEIGGYFYIEQPQGCMTWRLEDVWTRQLLDELSTSCIRDQCFDGLKTREPGDP